MKSQKIKTFTSAVEASEFLKKGCALAIGNFDGVHHGHQFILNNLVKKAKEKKIKSVLLTFEPHPVKVLSPESAPRLITTRNQKIELLSETELDVVIFQEFSKVFARTHPEKFFAEVIAETLHTQYLSVGYDFTFGKGRTGTIETLEHLAPKHRIELKIIEAQMVAQTLCSSSVIRKMILEGNFPVASKLLTRPFFIDGTVVSGHKRGTALGIHTANLKTENELIPPDGVYATWITLGKQTFQSVTNIGYNPTFDNLERSIETHILDFSGDIYDKTVRLSFVKRLRMEIKFATPTALVKQIGIDIEEARKVLSSQP